MNGNRRPGTRFQTGPGLFIPARYTRVVVHPGPEIGLFSDYGEITGRERDTDTFHKLLTDTSLEPAVLRLASINLGIYKAKMDSAPQQALARLHIRPEHGQTLLALAKKDRGGRQPNARLLFHRGGLLTALKAVIAFSATNDRPGLDASVLGDLVLLANELVSGAGAVPEGDYHDPLTLVTEFLPGWELYNPPDLGYGLARTRRLFEILWGDDLIRHRNPVLGPPYASSATADARTPTFSAALSVALRPAPVGGADKGPLSRRCSQVRQPVHQPQLPDSPPA